MFRSNSGYIFESRVDCSGKKGIKESVDIFNGVAKLEVGIDNTGKITRAKYLTVESGFKPLAENFGTPELIETFRRSHRATYAVIGESSYMAKITYNMRTGKVDAELYIVIEDVQINNGKTIKPGVSCYKIDTQKGTHRFVVKEAIINSFVAGIKKQLMGMDFTSKSSYLLSRL